MAVITIVRWDYKAINEVPVIHGCHWISILLLLLWLVIAGYQLLLCGSWRAHSCGDTASKWANAAFFAIRLSAMRFIIQGGEMNNNDTTRVCRVFGSPKRLQIFRMLGWSWPAKRTDWINSRDFNHQNEMVMSAIYTKRLEAIMSRVSCKVRFSPRVIFSIPNRSQPGCKLGGFSMIPWDIYKYLRGMRFDPISSYQLKKLSLWSGSWQRDSQHAAPWKLLINSCWGLEQQQLLLQSFLV